MNCDKNAVPLKKHIPVKKNSESTTKVKAKSASQKNFAVKLNKKLTKRTQQV